MSAKNIQVLPVSTFGITFDIVEKLMEIGQGRPVIAFEEIAVPDAKTGIVQTYVRQHVFPHYKTARGLFNQIDKKQRQFRAQNPIAISLRWLSFGVVI